MYYSVEIQLKLESEPWSQQSCFDIRNGKPNVTSLLTKLGESRKNRPQYQSVSFKFRDGKSNSIYLNTLALIFTWNKVSVLQQAVRKEQSLLFHSHIILSHRILLSPKVSL